MRASTLLLTAFPLYALAEDGRSETPIPECASLDVMRDLLFDRHGERLMFAGSVAGYADGYAGVGIWTTPDGGTWTATTTRMDGMTCIVAFGDAHAFVIHPEGDPT